MRNKVLLIDNSETIHKIVNLTLDRRYFDLIDAYSIQEGLRLTAEEKPSVALIDSKLFADTGEDVILNLKNTAPNMGIVLLIGAYDRFSETGIEYAFIDDCLIKPFNANALNSVITTIIIRRNEHGLRSEAAANGVPETSPGGISQNTCAVIDNEPAEAPEQPLFELLYVPEETVSENEINKKMLSENEAETPLDQPYIIEPQLDLAPDPLIEPLEDARQEALKADEPAEPQPSDDDVPLFDEQSLSQLGIDISDLADELELSAEKSALPDEDEPALPEIPLTECVPSAQEGDETAATPESTETEEVEPEAVSEEAGADEPFMAVPDIQPDKTSPISEILDIMDNTAMTANDSINIEQVDDMLESIDLNPIQTPDTLNIGVEDILEPDEYNFSTGNAFQNVESIMASDDEAIPAEEALQNELAAELEIEMLENTDDFAAGIDPIADLVSRAGAAIPDVEDMFNADEPDLFINTHVFDSDVAPSYSVYEADSLKPDASVNSVNGKADGERQELDSLFDELHLSFENDSATPAPVTKQKAPADSENGPEAEKNLAAKLVIELSHKELVKLLEHSMNKEILEKIVREILQDSIGNAVERLVPKLAEQLVREELRLIKGE